MVTAPQTSLLFCWSLLGLEGGVLALKPGLGARMPGITWNPAWGALTYLPSQDPSLEAGARSCLLMDAEAPSGQRCPSQLPALALPAAAPLPGRKFAASGDGVNGFLMEGAVWHSVLCSSYRSVMFIVFVIHKLSRN